MADKNVCPTIMKVIDLLERRRRNWQELERLCDDLQVGRTAPQPQAASGASTGGGRPTPVSDATSVNISQAEKVSRFGALYRAACADLALAYAYQLPQNTVQYLHRLVGRAHNQLYRSRRFEWAKWAETLVFEVPKVILVWKQGWVA